MKLRILEKFTKPRTLARLERDLRFAEERLKVLEHRYLLAQEGLKQVEAQTNSAKPTVEPKSKAGPAGK